MHLLSPDDIKTDQTQELAKKRALVARIAEEEARVNQSLNQAKERDLAERDRLQAEFEVFEEKIAERSAELSREVSALESRRAHALKPIEHIQKEAEALLEQNKKDEASLREREGALREKEEAVVDRVEEFADREQVIAEREESLATREDRMKREEERLRVSQVALSGKWSEYHAQVHLTNGEIESRELAIKAERAGIEAGRKANTEEAQRLTNERRALQDAYLALEQAKIHLNQNHG
jgi:hypothetical protein